nr:putative ORF1 [Marmot picobirnavirus]
MTRARDSSSREIGLGNLNESIRHNKSQEQLALGTLQENQRHNMSTERNAAGMLAEQMRANMARERETFRHNVAGEDELTRSNLAREQETSRHNISAENIALRQHEETVRSNLARETETNRHNVVSEITAGTEAATRAGQLAENVRHNMAYEAETALHNRAMELKDYGSNVTVQGGTTTNTTEASDVNVYGTGYRYYDPGEYVYVYPNARRQFPGPGGRTGGGFGGRSRYLPAPNN